MLDEMTISPDDIDEGCDPEEVLFKILNGDVDTQVATAGVKESEYTRLFDRVVTNILVKDQFQAGECCDESYYQLDSLADDKIVGRIIENDGLGDLVVGFDACGVYRKQNYYDPWFEDRIEMRVAVYYVKTADIDKAVAKLRAALIDAGEELYGEEEPE